jgi:hypothetical protein
VTLKICDFEDNERSYQTKTDLRRSMGEKGKKKKEEKEEEEEEEEEEAKE